MNDISNLPADILNTSSQSFYPNNSYGAFPTLSILRDATTPDSIEVASNSIQHWVNVIGSVTSLFSFFSAVLIAILGFVTYKNYQLKNQSEEDARSISKNKEDSLELFDKVKEDYDSFSKQLMEWDGEIKLRFDESNRWRDDMQKIMSETTKILEEMKTGLGNAVEAERLIKQVKGRIDSLASPSPSPSIPAILNNSALQQALETQRKFQEDFENSKIVEMALKMARDKK